LPLTDANIIALLKAQSKEITSL